MNIVLLEQNQFYYIFDSDNGKISVGKYSEENPTGAKTLEEAADIALHCFDNVEE